MKFAFMSIAHKWCQNHTVNTLHYHIFCVRVFVLVFLLGFVYPWAMLRSTEIELKTAFVGKVFTWESKRGFCESHLTWYFAPGLESLAIRGRAYSLCRVKRMSTLPHFHDACLALRLHCKVFLCKMCLVAGTNYAAFRFHVKVKKKSSM